MICTVSKQFNEEMRVKCQNVFHGLLISDFLPAICSTIFLHVILKHSTEVAFKFKDHMVNLINFDWIDLSGVQ